MPEFLGALGKENAVHLLKRAGFGPRGREFVRFGKKTPDLAFTILWKPPLKGLGPKDKVDKFQRFWLRKMKSNNHRLREKLTLFWHDHFGINIKSVNGSFPDNTNRMFAHIRLLRTMGLGDPRNPGTGKFRDLMIAITGDLAMLDFLNGNQNLYPFNINENYGRELQELFMLGVLDLDGAANYLEEDVQEISRALTGYRPNGVFDYAVFDRFDKTLYANTQQPGNAKTGELGVLDQNQNPLPPNRNVIDIILNHRDSDNRPTSARYIAKKMWEWFAYPLDPLDTDDRALIDELADAFVGTGDYYIQDLLKAILTNEAFYPDQGASPRNTRAEPRTIKNPIELVVGTIRALKLGTNMERLAHGGERDEGERPSDKEGHLGKMGMNPLFPPRVEGWELGLPFVTTGPWLSRLQFAQDVGAGRDPRNHYKLRIDRVMGKVKRNGQAGPAELVDAYLAELHLRVAPAGGPVPLGQIPFEVRTDLIGYLPDKLLSAYTEDEIETKVRGLIVLILMLPEYHIH